MSRLFRTASVAVTTVCALALTIPTMGATVSAAALPFPTDTVPLPAVAPPAHNVDDGIFVPAPEAAAENEGPVSDTPPTVSHSLAQLVALGAAPAAGERDLNCLATAVYFESKGEPLAGQLAVAEVILNRARSGRFASSICGVVTQPSQFSFVRRGAMPRVTSGAQWREAVGVARVALDEAYRSPAQGALFFHARRVSPSWNRQRVASVGNHIFYR